jgi:hypothetical protein
VEVIFGAGSVRETLAKISAFTPFSLLLGVLLLILWTTLNRLTLSPLRLALALLGLSLGFSFGGVLTGYLPPLWVERLGAALALLSLGARSCRSCCWWRWPRSPFSRCATPGCCSGYWRRPHWCCSCGPERPLHNW